MHSNDLLDRTGIWVSLSCFVHCIATAILFSVPGLVSGWLRFLPMLEQLEHVFLLLAVGVAGVSLIPSYRRHKERVPLALFVCGALAWGLRLAAPGGWEIMLTMTGVAFVTTAHTLNMRAEHRCHAHHAKCC